jgi:PAS domain S-box-containing protein
MTLLGPIGDLRIRYKLLLGYSTVLILSFSLAGFIINAFVRKTIETNIENELKNTTAAILHMVHTSADVSIKNWLRAVAEKNKEIVQHFYDQYRNGTLDEAEAKARARDILLSQTIGTTGYIYCLNRHGVIVMHPKAALMGVDLSRYAFIREQMARKQGYIEYDWKNPDETHARPKALYMTYFAPWDWIISVSSYRSEFRQLVNVSDFRESILSLKFGKTGYSYVLDGHGKMIIHPTLEGIDFYNARDAKGRYFIREICRHKSGKIIYSWKNPGEKAPREKLVMFNYIPELDWIVASSSYLEEFYAPVKTVRDIIVFTVIGLLFLVLPLTLRISSSITNPLQALMDCFYAGAGGDISVRMKPRSRDEIGQLARYFNIFMEKLEVYSRKLQTEIGDRQRAEAAIRKSEAKYRELVQNANSIILRMTPSGEITFFNEFAQRFFGYTETQILGRNVVGTILAERDSDGRDLTRMIRDISRHADRYNTYEIETVRSNGQRAWISWTNRAIRNTEGNIVENLCIGNDVTDARRAQHEMARMRLYLKNVIDSMPSVLVGVDCQMQVIQWNREAEKVTGMAQHEAIGQRLDAVYPQIQDQMQAVERAIAEASVKKIEKVLRHGNGLHYDDIVIYPLILQGVEGAVIRVDDVTARVGMEDMMVQSEKMMSIGGLAAGMAHEINNPLGGILQSAQNIQRRISVELGQNHQVARECGTDLETIRAYFFRRGLDKFIEGIRESGQRASQTVANMLNFSRRSETRMTLTHMGDLLEKAVALASHDYDLKKKYHFRRIEIIRDFQPDLPPVPCAATEIEQVVFNLLKNAAQAMDRTDAPAITLRLRKGWNTLRLEIQDNGPGMDESTRKRIFEPFFTTKDVGVGTGLGLSVSYFIVTNHHRGTMAVESTPKKGTTFVIELPLVQ